MSETNSNRYTTPAFAAVISAGLAGVVTYNWQSHSFDQATDNREFLQRELIDNLQSQTRASEKVAAHIAQSVEIQRDLAEQVDDLGDESRALNRWVESFVRGSERLEYAQEALQEEFESLPRGGWAEPPMPAEEAE